MISRKTMAITVVVMSMAFPSEAMSASVCNNLPKDYSFDHCATHLATWECRGLDSGFRLPPSTFLSPLPSTSQMFSCWLREYRRIYQGTGRRIPDLSRAECVRFGPAITCGVGEFGAEEWCMREDADTVSYYEDAPPDHRLIKRDTNCPVGRCHCGFQRAGITR
jgi:hypothetical protein